MARMIRMRVDDSMKIKSDMLFKDLKRTATENSPYDLMVEEEILAKLEKSRIHGTEGKYREADAVIADMKSKYEL